MNQNELNEAFLTEAVRRAIDSSILSLSQRYARRVSSVTLTPIVERGADSNYVFSEAFDISLFDDAVIIFGWNRTDTGPGSDTNQWFFSLEQATSSGIWASALGSGVLNSGWHPSYQIGTTSSGPEISGSEPMYAYLTCRGPFLKYCRAAIRRIAGGATAPRFRYCTVVARARV